MYSIKTIRGAKAVIHCKNIEEAKALYSLVERHHSYNYTGIIVSNWDRYESETCYRLNAAGVEGVGWGYRNWYENEGYEIIPFNELLPVTNQ